MAIPYRTRRALRRLAIAGLVLVLAAVLVWLVWLLWLDRYVVYSRDGARLDFSISDEGLTPELASPPEVGEDVSIFYNEGENALNTSLELGQLYGYYITQEMLEDDPAGVLAILRQLPEQSPVLIQLKDITGRFFYDSEVGTAHAGMDLAAVKEILNFIDRSNLYGIAMVPAFRDYYYGLDHVPDGLPTSKGYLWMDEARCYWLRPDSESVLAYLIQIANEIKAMGFAEVVFSDFRFPNTDKIVFKSDKNEALALAAQRLMENCGSDRFAVSFLVERSDFPLPPGRSRVYMEGRTAGEARSLADSSGLADPAVNLVFLTDLNDTRFDAYSVLRPITSAQLEQQE